VGPAWLRRRGSLIALVALGSILSIIMVAAGLAFRHGLGTSFGYRPNLGMALIVGGVMAALAAFAALIVALAMVLIPSLRRRVAGGARGTPAGTDAASGPAATRRLTIIALAVALVGGSVLLLFAAYNALYFGYGTAGTLVLLGTGMLGILGVAAVVVVLAFLPRRTTRATSRATSLGTRSFVVLVVAMVVPSLLLAGLGAYASVWAWEAAAGLRSEQAQYSAQRLADDVDSLRSVPGGLRPAARAGLTRAIVQAYAAGNTGGAWLSTTADVRGLRVLPRWAIRELTQRGYAIGAMDGGESRGLMPDIVAWRAGPQEVRYFTSEAVSVPVDDSSIPLYRAPLGELAAIAGMGMAIVVCLGLLGAWILSRGVVRPVRRLSEASGRLAEGEAGVTVTPEGPRELRELATSFNDMNAKLAKAQETEQAFLLSVSHELKTPLTSIRGYAEGIGDGTVKPPEGAAVIGVESSRLERLVGDLLDSARMRKSAFAVRRERVDLATLAQDVGRRYEGTAREAGLTLYLKTDAGGAVVADNDRLLQVVSNLVENAIRCTPAPGSVTITTAPGTVTVSDTGRGLTGDDLPRAFERFYLYTRYGTDRPVGTGLGLAIVKELTEAMGGRVSVSSAVGVGTAFIVELPRDDAPVTVSQPRADDSPTLVLPQDDVSVTVAQPQDDASPTAELRQDDASPTAAPSQDDAS
jgi:signal transduction histidine kinase